MSQKVSAPRSGRLRTPPKSVSLKLGPADKSQLVELLGFAPLAINLGGGADLLDPDNKLLSKFQEGLRRHLVGRNEKLNLEIQEMKKGLALLQQQRGQITVAMYELQKKVAGHRDFLQEACPDKSLDPLSQQREELEKSRNQHNTTLDSWRNHQDLEAQLAGAKTNLDLQLLHLRDFHRRTSSHSKVMKTVARRTSRDCQDLLDDNCRKDYLIMRLQEDTCHQQDLLDKSKVQAQYSKQEADSLRQQIAAAEADLKNLADDHHGLVGRWRQWVVWLQRRDQSHAALLDRYRRVESQVVSLQMQLRGQSKPLREAHGTAERLGMEVQWQQKLAAQLAVRESQLTEHGRSQVGNLDTLTACVIAANQRLDTLDQKKISLEKLWEELVLSDKQLRTAAQDLEAQYLEVFVNLPCLSNAARSTRSNIKKNAISNLQKELELQKRENEVAKKERKSAAWRNRVASLEFDLRELRNREMEEARKLKQEERDSSARDGHLDVAQSKVARLRDKEEQLSHGGFDGSPYEREMQHLRQEIRAIEEKCRQLETAWLGQHRHLIQSRDTLALDAGQVSLLDKKVKVLSHVCLKAEGEVEEVRRRVKQARRQLDHLHRALVQLNVDLAGQDLQADQLAGESQAAEVEMAAALREAEQACAQRSEQLTNIQAEIHRLVDQMVESERDVLVWTRRLYLAEKAKKSLTSGPGYQDMVDRRRELRRVQLELSHLHRDIQALSQSLSGAVQAYATTTTKLDIQKTLGSTKPFFQQRQRRLEGELTNKVTLLNQKQLTLVSTAATLRATRGQLESRQQSARAVLSNLESEISAAQLEIECCSREKFKNLMKLLVRQGATKLLEQLKERRYKPLVALVAEAESTKLQALSTVLSALLEEFPSAQLLRRPLDCCAVGEAELAIPPVDVV